MFRGMLLRRSKFSLYLLLAPILVLLWLFAMDNLNQRAFEGSVKEHQQRYKLGRIPPCSIRNENCKTIRYAPANVPWVDRVMEDVARQTGLDFGSDVVNIDFGGDMNTTSVDAGVAAAVAAAMSNGTNNIPTLFSDLCKTGDLRYPKLIPDKCSPKYALKCLSESKSKVGGIDFKTTCGGKKSLFGIPCLPCCLPCGFLRDHARLESIFNRTDSTALTVVFTSAYLPAPFGSIGKDVPIQTGHLLFYNQSDASAAALLHRENFSIHLKRALDQALLAAKTGWKRTVDFTTWWSHFPLPKAAFADNDVVGGQGALWLYGVPASFFYSLVTEIVAERTSGLRFAVQVSGVRSYQYWASWLLNAIVLTAFSSFLLVFIGRFVFEFDFFVNCDPTLNFTVFWLINLAMSSMGACVSTIVSSPKAAQGLSAAIVTLGFMLQMGLCLSDGMLVKILFSNRASLWVRVVRECMGIIMPWVPFTLIFYSIGSQTTQLGNIYGDAQTAKYFGWSNTLQQLDIKQSGFGSATVNNMLNKEHLRGLPIDSIYTMIFQVIGYILLTWYLDMIFTGGDGATGDKARSIFFPFHRISLTCQTFLCRNGRNDKPSPSRRRVRSGGYASDFELDDVAGMSDGSSNSDMSRSRTVLRVSRLRKEFPKRSNQRKTMCNRIFCRCKKKNKVTMRYHDIADDQKDQKSNFVAVERMSFSVSRGKIVAMLGHNGAGKTTTIRCIIGGLAATSGRVYVDGVNACSNPSEARTRIGICPQFDILWPYLSAREHLRLFAKLKGVVHDFVEEHVAGLLEEVRLLTVADRAAGSLSGGMKRRLTLAIAACGDPSLLLLDEPTTGMDPAVRRETWNMIRCLKDRCGILMTTHMMIEADKLADSILVMSKGRKLASGHSLKLKRELGGGYFLNVHCRNFISKKRFVKALLETFLVAEEVKDGVVGGTACCFRVPFENENCLPEILEWIESLEEKENGDLSIPQTSVLNGETKNTDACRSGDVMEWGISYPSIEDVFSSITTSSDAGHSDAIKLQEKQNAMEEEILFRDEDIQQDSPKRSKLMLPHKRLCCVKECLVTTLILKKNFLIQRKQVFANFAQLLAPISYILFIVFMNKAVRANVKILPFQSSILDRRQEVGFVINSDEIYGSGRHSPSVEVIDWNEKIPEAKSCISWNCDQIGQHCRPGHGKPYGRGWTCYTVDHKKPRPDWCLVPNVQRWAWPRNIDTLKASGCWKENQQTVEEDNGCLLWGALVVNGNETFIGNLDGNGSGKGMLGNIEQSFCKITVNATNELGNVGMETGEGYTFPSDTLNVPFFKKFNSFRDVETLSLDVMQNNRGSAKAGASRGRSYFSVPDFILSFGATSNSTDLLHLSYNYTVNDVQTLYSVRRNALRRPLGHEMMRHYTVYRLRIMEMVHSAFLDEVGYTEKGPTAIELGFPEATQSIVDAVNKIMKMRVILEMPKWIEHSSIYQIDFVFQIGYPMVLCFSLPVMMNLIVVEKERKIFHLQRTMGVSSIAYVLSSLITNFCVYMFSVFVFWGVGHFSGVLFFRETDSKLLLLFFIGWGFALVALAQFLSVLVKTARMASILGYLLAVFGSLACGLVSSMVFGKPFVVGVNFQPDNELPFWLYAWPQFGVTRAIFVMCYACYMERQCMDMNILTLGYGRGHENGDGSLDTVDEDLYENSDGLTYGWDKDALELALELRTAIISLFVCAFLYLIAGLVTLVYGEKIDRKIQYVKASLHNYCNIIFAAMSTVLFKILCCNNSSAKQNEKSFLEVGSSHVEMEMLDLGGSNVAAIEEDTDVAKERLFATALVQKREKESKDDDNIDEEDDNATIIISNLHKRFPGAQQDSVDGLSLVVRAGECFGLLGENGAGKTTSIRIITAAEPASSGSAWMDGVQMAGMKKSGFSKSFGNQASIGICPQHERLWERLTPRDHLNFYAQVKSSWEVGGTCCLSSSRDDREVTDLLTGLGLLPVSDKPVAELSGGMRRRLSVGIALVGRSPIVLLDEPSTGLDPLSRRLIWRQLGRARQSVRSFYGNGAKRKRPAVILTTHNMDEAEALCTRCGIMTSGKLRCIGTPQRLKNLYATGYRLQINFQPGFFDCGAMYDDEDEYRLPVTRVDAIVEHILELFPTATVYNHGSSIQADDGDGGDLSEVGEEKAFEENDDDTDGSGAFDEAFDEAAKRATLANGHISFNIPTVDVDVSQVFRLMNDLMSGKDEMNQILYREEEQKSRDGNGRRSRARTGSSQSLMSRSRPRFASDASIIIEGLGITDWGLGQMGLEDVFCVMIEKHSVVR
eukprot:g2476.t1